MINDNTMNTKYLSIYYKYNFNDPINFKRFVAEAFAEAEKINPKNGINKMFIPIYRNHRTLEAVKYMISLGVDPHFNNEYIFVLSCGNIGTDVLSFLINECNVNVDVNNKDVLLYSEHNPKIRLFLLVNGLITADNIIIKGCIRKSSDINLLIDHGYDINSNDEFLSEVMYNNFTDGVKLLLDLGIKIRDKNIIDALDKPEYLKMFVEYGIDPEHIGKLLIENIWNKHLPTAKFLLQTNVDLNQLILNCDK